MDEYRRKQKELDAEAEYEEVVVDEFACAACKKVYKKENQLKQHLQSKAHKDTIKKLKLEVQLDE